MLFTDVIRTKRDGGALSAEQIQIFVDGLADGSIPTEQVSALAMAIFLNSMSFEEAGLLTSKMEWLLREQCLIGTKKILMARL